MARLTDEQLAEWAAKQAGTQSGDVLAELLAARKVVEAARKACAAKPGYRVHECLDLVLEDIIAYDKATNAARPQE